MKRSLLDTNVLIDWLNRGDRPGLVEGAGRVRLLSAVVVMELRAGALTPGANRAVDRLAKAFGAAQRLIAPSPTSWDRAGELVRKLKRSGREVRRASLVNDVLIALTAREVGAVLVTADGSDFEAIRRHCDFELEIVR